MLGSSGWKSRGGCGLIVESDFTCTGQSFILKKHNTLNFQILILAKRHTSNWYVTFLNCSTCQNLNSIGSQTKTKV